MKKKVLGLVAVATAAALTIGGGLAGCNNNAESWGDTEYKGVTESKIVVGNCAGTTGANAKVGIPFNVGIEAAFYAYNQAGGFTYKKEDGTEGKRTVELKHYDDGSVSTQSVTLMEKLIHEDEVFAIVGNVGSDCVKANIDVIKEAKVPMVYAASGMGELYNENATTIGDRCILPVQLLNNTEGRMLLLRAFAPTDKGGMGGTKVGVIGISTVDASVEMMKGINAEMTNLTAEQKSNVVIQNVSSNENYSTAVAALKNSGCDVVIVTSIQDDYSSILEQFKSQNYDNVKIITSYNNSSTEFITDTSVMTATRLLYAQAWLNIYADPINYNGTNSYKGNALAGAMLAATYTGVNPTALTLFSADYWGVAENIYAYYVSTNPSDLNEYGFSLQAFNYTYNPYALAGYIAGDTFCQGLEIVEEDGKELTRQNFVEAMESKEINVRMGDSISFKDGKRVAVERCALTQFYDYLGTPQSATIYGLTSLEEYRELIK